MLKFNGHDPIGKLIWDFHSGKKKAQVRVFSNMSDPDVINGSYLFRNYNAMPQLEQKALELCRGNILDIGAATGCHANYLIEMGFKVECIDISAGAVAYLQAKGISAQQANFFNYHSTKQYDTLLMLMNGIGICGKIERLGSFFLKADQLLKPGGQLLFDSSDLQYIFYEATEKALQNLSPDYYGEVIYEMQYADQKTRPFNWLFIDHLTLQEWGESFGFRFELIQRGSHFDYLARLIKPAL